MKKNIQTKNALPGLSPNAAATDYDGQIGGGEQLVPIQMRGGSITYREPGNLPTGSFSRITNMRGRHPGYSKRKGQHILHSSAQSDGTNKAMSMFQFNKSRVSDDHFFVQWSDGDIHEASEVLPTVASDAFGSEVYSAGSDVTNLIPASWCVLNDLMIVTDGVSQHQIYAGDGSYIDAFFVYDSDVAPGQIPDNGRNYTDQVTDGKTTTVAVLDSLEVSDCIFIATPVPANKLSWTIQYGNDNASTATLYYKKSDNTWADTSMTDGTAVGSDTLYQSGDMTWTLPSDEISSYMYGSCAFWYKLQVSATLDAQVEVSSVTFGAPFQDLRNIWDGVPVDAVEVQVEMSDSRYYRYGASAVTVGSLPVGSPIFMASADKLEGVYNDVGSTPNNSGASISDIQYWDGTSWTSASSVEDGTNGLANTGWITFQRQTDVEKRQFGTSYYDAYWYRITFDTILHSDMVIAMQGMPYFNIDDFGKAGLVNTSWKNRLLVTFDKFPEYIYVSAASRPMVFNGEDFDILETADGRSNKITNMKKYYNELLVWQEELGVDSGTTTLFQGYNPATFGQLMYSNRIGTFNAKSAVVIDGVRTSTATDEKIGSIAFFLSRYGVCKFDGISVEIISDDIRNYFDPRESECIRRGYEEEMWISYDSYDHVLRLGLVSGSSATTPNIFPVYDLIDKVWYFDDFNNELSSMVECNAGSGDIDVLQIGGGVDDGKIYQLNKSLYDYGDGSGIDGSITVEVDEGGYDVEVKEILVRVKEGGAGTEIDIETLANGAVSDVYTKSMATEGANWANIRRHRFHTNLRGDHIQIAIHNDQASEFYIENLMLNMNIETVK